MCPMKLLFRGAVHNTSSYFVERSIRRPVKPLLRGAVHNTSSETVISWSGPRHARLRSNCYLVEWFLARCPVNALSGPEVY